MRNQSLLPTQQKIEDYRAHSKAALKKYIELRQANEETISKRQGVTKRTIQNRLADPGTMQLKDLWELAVILKCPVGEICGGELPEELIGKWIAAVAAKDNS